MIGFKVRRLGISVGALFALAAFWQAAASITSSIAFPSLMSILRVAPRALESLLRDHLPPTLLRLATAHLIGSVLGVTLAITMYSLPVVGSGFRGYIDFFRSIPGTIMFPFFLGLIGIQHWRGEVVIGLPSAWVVVWIVAFAVYTELALSRSGRLRYLKRHGASTIFVLRHLHAYALTRGFFLNARIAVSIALAVLVAMEMFAGPSNGIGYYARFQQEDLHFEELVVCIVTTGVIGICLNYCFGRAERFVESRIGGENAAAKV